MHRRNLRKRLAPYVMATVMAVGVVGLPAPARADTINTSWNQLSSFWPYWSDTVCVAATVQEFRNDATATQFSKVGVGSSRFQNASGFSFSYTLKRFSLSFTPQPKHCASNHQLGSQQLFVWMKTEFFPADGRHGWRYCNGTMPQYNAYPSPNPWSVNLVSTHEHNYVIGSGSQRGGCGPGYYFTYGTVLAIQNGVFTPAHVQPMTLAGRWYLRMY